MRVNIFNLIINFYLSTVIAAIIGFALNFRRLDRYYRKQGLRAVFNEGSLTCLLKCFRPILNIFKKKIRKNKKRRWHCEAYYKTKSFCRLLY